MAEPDILVIDDARTFPFPAVHARTVAEGIRRLGQRGWREVWLDWNLGGGGTMAPVVDLLVERAAAGDAFPIGIVAVHTSDPVAAERMLAALGRWYRVRRQWHRPVPGAW